MSPPESPIEPSSVLHSSQFSPGFYVLLGFLVSAAIGGPLFVRLLKRRGTKQPPYWIRLLWELLAGVIAALILHLLRRGFASPSVENTTEGLIHAFLVALTLELCHTAHSLTAVRVTLGELYERITNDERILFARTEPLERARDISLIGVERLPTGQIPAPLEPPPGGGEWALTISLLRLDRFQDLLFSTEYLKHFLKLHQATKKQYRILVLNDNPRAGSEAAILSFLQMSDTLGIETYNYLKSEFYGMIRCLDKIKHADQSTARDVQEIMNGQPELSLMHDDSVKSEPSALKADDDYKLRFREENGRIVECGRDKTEWMQVDRLDWVHRLLHVAIRVGDRRGLESFPRVLRKSCPNPWADCNERLGFVKQM